MAGRRLPVGKAVRPQTQVNDLLAAQVRGRPDRFQALATLATPDPAAAAKELGRAATRRGLNGAMPCGRTRERNIDRPDFWFVYEAAAAPAVHAAYHEGFAPDVSMMFAFGGIGWAL